jgi:4'-phosphopantetheinyl transferase
MIAKKETYAVYPVILSVPPSFYCEGQQLKGRERGAFLSRYARCALEISGRKSGYEPIPSDLLPKDENGAPLPVNGKYWSVTHKPEYVGGVFALKPVGMDIEKIRPCSPLIFKKIADDREWHLTATSEPLQLFFRFWTSKEAVLKATGAGIKGLSECKIAEISDEHHLIIICKHEEWLVEHFYFDGHIASVVKNECDVNWMCYGKKAGEMLKFAPLISALRKA